MCDRTWPTTLSASTGSNVRTIDRENEFLRGPKWRTRTTPERRRAAAAATLFVVILVGSIVMIAAMWLLERLSAPTWIVVLPWLAPTLGVVIWSIVGADPASATDDDDDPWVGYSVRWAFAGEGREGAAGTARPAPLRVIVAAVAGAPICWAYLVFGLLALVGFE